MKTLSILKNKYKKTQENRNHPLYFLKPPGIKVGFQQQKAYKLMETEKLSTELPLGQGRN